MDTVVLVGICMQGVSPEDDHPACGGRHAGNNVELQEVQRLIHGAIRGPWWWGLLQDVRATPGCEKKQRAWSSNSEDIIVLKKFLKTLLIYES